MLKRRFGQLSPQQLDLLRHAAVSQLESWADRVLDARQIEDVFGD
jgi:hypothetical protein